MDSGSWWRIGRPGVQWFMGSQRVGHDWVTELNFSFSRQQKQTISWSDCDLWWKVDFIQQPLMTSSVAGLRRSSKALPKAKLAPKKVMGTVSWSAAYLIHYSFWISVKPLHLGSMLSKSMRYTKNCNISSHHLSIERASSSPWQCLTIGHTTSASKIEWIWLQSFASSSIFTWPLTNWHLDNFLQGECFYNQQDAENVF